MQDDRVWLWWRRLRRVVGFARARAVLRGCELGSRVFTEGVVEARPAGGAIVIGSRCVFLSGLEPTRLVGAPGATLAIGEGTVVNYGTLLESNGGDIDIGPDCLFASGVRVLAEAGRPVRVGADVWLAHGAVVTPGVTIGDGAVVAAAAVVTRDVPARTIAIGNPARTMSLELLGGAHGATRSRTGLPSAAQPVRRT